MKLVNEKDLRWTQVSKNLSIKYLLNDYEITSNAVSGGIANWPKGEAGVPHTHPDHDEVYIVLRGKGRVNVGGEIKEVQTGDMLHAKAGEVHGMIEGLTEGGIDLFFMLIPKGKE